MKKFNPSAHTDVYGRLIVTMKRDPNGDNVPADLAEEMLEVLKKADKKIQHWSINADIGGSASREILAELQSIIAKAEEE